MNIYTSVSIALDETDILAVYISMKHLPVMRSISHSGAEQRRRYSFLFNGVNVTLVTNLPDGSTASGRYDLILDIRKSNLVG